MSHPDVIVGGVSWFLAIVVIIFFRRISDALDMFAEESSPYPRFAVPRHILTGVLVAILAGMGPIALSGN